MKKIILLIAVFITLLPKVYSKEVTLGVDKIGSTFAYFYDSSQEKNRYVYAEKYYFDTNLAYCLELGKKIYSSNYITSSSFESLNISDEKLEKIKLITHYGYNYPNHNTDTYFMAAQELIWNEMSDINLTWVRDLIPSNVVDVSEERNEIINLVNKHYIKPSFDNETIEYTLGVPLVLEDTNNVLSNFKTPNENVSIEDNKLIINENFNAEEIILTKSNYTDKEFILYTSGDSQRMISTGIVDEVTSNIKIKLIGGSLNVTKLDKDTKTNSPQGEATLKSAVYELYDEEGKLVDTIITGKKEKIENLKLGKYKLKEVNPSKGYLIDNNIYDIEINRENLNIELELYEEVIKRKVEIFKVFASNTTGELSPEPDISFEIYDKNNTLMDTIVTDEDGYANVILPYGTYTFKQINTTKNYYKVDDFKVSISEQDERPIYKLLSDSKISAKIKIIKKDIDTNENILNSSTKFKIFDVTNNKYLSLSVSYPENKETIIFEVDKNGIFITPIPLEAGEYILEEVPESLNGYLYNEEKIKFSINESSNLIEENNEMYLEVPFYNKRVKGTINIIKYGEELIIEDNEYYYKEILLKDVIFNIYAKENIYENEKLIYQKDELVKEVITNKEGTISISNLPLGKYYIKEISTVNNHILEETIYDIELKYKDELTEVVTSEIKINNYLPKGKLIINKYDTETNSPIPNTLVEVRTKNNEILYKGYTDEDGQIVLEDILYGEYYLSEIEAATGYRILEDKIQFEISDETKIIEIYNERLKVPNTGMSLKLLDIMVIALSLLGIILIIIYHNDKRIILASVIIIVLGVLYFLIIIYNIYNDSLNNKESITAYINNEIETVAEDKYKYSSILEIPSINLKRGLLNIENEYNDAKYNIELIKEDENTIVLAAHNGTNLNSYFGNLHNIEIGDEINYYKDGNKYKYVYSEKYDIKKNGYADIYRKDNEKSIILITCKDNTSDVQTVYIGYLKEIYTY